MKRDGCIRWRVHRSRSPKISLCVALVSAGVFSFATQLWAQSIDDIIPDFSPEESKILSNGFGAYTSALTVFTSRNGASSGSFSLDDDSGDFSVTSIPVSYTFGDQGDPVRFNLRGAVGQYEARQSISEFSSIYSELEPELPPELQGLPNGTDFARSTATSLTVGGGVIFEPVAGLKIEPAFDVVWTHIKNRWDYHNIVSALVGAKFDRDLFNTSLEAISYSPSLRADYEIDLGCGYQIIPSVVYTHLWSYDLWSKSQFSDFSIDSGVLQSRVGASIPISAETFGRQVALQPFVIRTDLYRAVRESLSENLMWDFGTDVAIEIKDSWIKEVRVGGAYIHASAFDGYRVNLGVDY